MKDGIVNAVDIGVRPIVIQVGRVERLRRSRGADECAAPYVESPPSLFIRPILVSIEGATKMAEPEGPATCWVMGNAYEDSLSA